MGSDLTGNGGVPKDTRRLIRTAQKQGWVVRLTGHNHVLFCSPEGATVITGGTPSSSRFRKNLLADLRRAGLTL